MRERSYHLTGTKLRWKGIRGWISTVRAVDKSFRASSAAYQRAKNLHRSLDADDIRRCTDALALEELEDILRQSRRTCDGFRCGPGRSLSRSELGALIVETANQRRWVASGCPAKREKGLKLDPRRIPDRRLDVLIQSHTNEALVEALRKEKRRREMLQRTDIQERAS